MSRRGFTLIELLLAIAILIVVLSIVYASFISVVNSADAVQTSAEELRLRNFLTQNLISNLASVHYRVSDELVDYSLYALVGVTERGSSGRLDALRFISTAPLLGGMGLPGDLKEVRVEAVDRRESGSFLDRREEEEYGEDGPPVVLHVSETPLLGANVQELSADDGNFVADENYEPPSWTAPIESLEIMYFDGEDWRDEWDSTLEGRMPWCVRMRINFWRSEAQRDAERSEGIYAEDNPDFELVASIPAGAGVRTEQVPLSFLMGGGGGQSVQGDAQQGTRPGLPANTRGTTQGFSSQGFGIRR